MSFAVAVQLIEEFKRHEALGLVDEDIAILQSGDQTVLFAGQIGGHIHLQAWQQAHLPGGSVDYVHLWIDLYEDHYDPDDKELATKKPFSQQNFYITKPTFIRLLGPIMSCITV